MQNQNNQEARKIDPEGEYYAIVIGRHGKHRSFWRNIVFSDPSIAMFYLEQEAFAYNRATNLHAEEAKREEFAIPIQVKDFDIPQRYSIEETNEWELVDKAQLISLFELPPELDVMISNYSITSSMVIPMVLHCDNMEQMFYSGRFAFLGNNSHNQLVSEHGTRNVSHGDSMLLGVRMRPAIQSPLRKHFFSMCGDGLPGLWYINIGERVEKTAMPSFNEKVKDWRR